MIRQATKYDKKQIIDMLYEFANESKVSYCHNYSNWDYINKLIDSILAGKGIIYIEDGVGLIMGIIVPTIWCDKTFALHELAWWVKPEKRGSTTGYRLLKTYVDYAKELKQKGRIQMFTITKMVTSPDIKYDKFGFSKIDENWVQ